MIFGLISAFYLAKHRRWGFLVGIVGGIGWMAFGIITQSIPSIIANVLFIIINARGFVRWKDKGQGGEADASEKKAASRQASPREA